MLSTLQEAYRDCIMLKRITTCRILCPHETKEWGAVLQGEHTKLQGIYLVDGSPLTTCQSDFHRSCTPLSANEDCTLLRVHISALSVQERLGFVVSKYFCPSSPISSLSWSWGLVDVIFLPATTQRRGSFFVEKLGVFWQENLSNFMFVVIDLKDYFSSFASQCAIFLSTGEHACLCSVKHKEHNCFICLANRLVVGLIFICRL